MKTLNIAEIDQQIKSLQKQKRLQKRQEREAAKKRKQRLCYIVGELFIKYFPDIQEIEPGTKSENTKNFASLEDFFDMLSSDETIMALFNECLTCMRNNQAQCVSGHIISVIRSNV